MREGRRYAALCLCVCLALLALPAGMAAAEAHVLATASVLPTAVMEPSPVRVSIVLINTAAEDKPLLLTLFDEEGRIITEFGEGGTMSLPPGLSTTFTYTHTVTEAQLARGELRYACFFMSPDEYGVPQPSVQTISIPISRVNPEDVQPVITIERSVKPGTTLAEGEVGTIRYTLENTGTVDIFNITISDAGLGATSVCDLLKVGDSAILLHGFTARQSAGELTSHPTLSYEYEVGDARVAVEGIKIEPPLRFVVESPES